MFATRDQENLVHGHQQAAAAKPLNQGTRGLQPKTPGNKYPKTPLRIPLNDENAQTAFGKTGKGKGLGDLVSGKKTTVFDKDAFVTPLGPRNRAPLGMKTTNAKTKGFQTPGPAQDKEIEKTQKPLTSTRKPKRVVHADAVKLEIHGDESPLVERDVEYCPPKPKDLPYESDTFPDGCLDYSCIKPENLMRGVFRSRNLEVDENGMTKMDRDAEEQYQKAAKAGDERIMAMLEEEWTLGDVPETFKHIRKKKVPVVDQPKPAAIVRSQRPTIPASMGPATITSRRAASALSVAPKSSLVQPKTSKPAPKPTVLLRSKPIPPPANASTMRAAASVVASRSTIGHTKGRSVSGILHTAQPAPVKAPRSGLNRSVSNMSAASDSTITPARFAQKENEKEWNSPAFMRAFEPTEDDDLSFGGGLAECLRREEEEEEEFVLTLPGMDEE